MPKKEIPRQGRWGNLTTADWGALESGCQARFSSFIRRRLWSLYNARYRTPADSPNGPAEATLVRWAGAAFGRGLMWMIATVTAFLFVLAACDTTESSKRE